MRKGHSGYRQEGCSAGCIWELKSPYTDWLVRGNLKDHPYILLYKEILAVSKVA